MNSVRKLLFAFIPFITLSGPFALAQLPSPQVAGLIIHITNGMSGVVTQPLIQIQGYSETQLQSITYTLVTNGIVAESGHGLVKGQSYDGQRRISWFQIYDVELVPGTNRVVIQFTNYAAVSATVELEYKLDYSLVRSPPTIRSMWPNNGDALSGDKFTLRGYVDDPTATVLATITASDGKVAEAGGDMERDGLFWVDDLPLAPGTNHIRLTLTNAAGWGRALSFYVTKSPVQITFTSTGGDAGLNKPQTTVTGTISTPGYTVWVNGVRATMFPDGTWRAENVPVTKGGTASFGATAIPNSDNNGNGTPPVRK